MSDMQYLLLLYYFHCSTLFNFLLYFLYFLSLIHLQNYLLPVLSVLLFLFLLLLFFLYSSWTILMMHSHSYYILTFVLHLTYSNYSLYMLIMSLINLLLRHYSPRYFHYSRSLIHTLSSAHTTLTSDYLSYSHISLLAYLLVLLHLLYYLLATAHITSIGLWHYLLLYSSTYLSVLVPWILYFLFLMLLCLSLSNNRYFT